MASVLTKNNDDSISEHLVDERVSSDDLQPQYQLTDGPGALVRVVELHKSFGENKVLSGVNLDMRPGEFVAVVGRSGCGKSTLLRLLSGLDKPTRGKIFINDKELLGVNRGVRVMFQDARLMPWMKVLDNVGLGLTGNWRDRANAALEDVGLQTRAKDWPGILSGGQRQRVSLARALVNEPQLMLLDEPHGALDAFTKFDMQNLLERIWLQRKFSALLITHDVEEAIALADRVILIQDGRIVMDVVVDLARPRDRARAAFVQLRNDVLHSVAGGILGPGADI